MKRVKDFLTKFRMNWDSYLTIIVAITITLLDLFQIVDENIVLPVILAVLGLVASSLLKNRKENDEIRKALSIADNIQSQLEELNMGIGVTHVFVPLRQGEWKVSTRKLTGLMKKASKEILVLDFNPLDEQESKILYDERDKISEERRLYYENIIEKVKKNHVKYKRILQVPPKRFVAEIVDDDEIFFDHCKEMITLGQKFPEAISLKSCMPIYEANFIIIDGRYLTLEVNILDPKNRFYASGGHFYFDDPSGKLIAEFRGFFERADAIASPIDIADLTLHR